MKLKRKSTNTTSMRSAICLHFILCFLITRTPAQTVHHLDNLVMSEIDAIVNNQIANSGLQGVSLGIIYNGRVAYTRAYGMGSPGVTATTSTKYLIASISKTITGVLAMKMVENDDFDLDDPISDFIGGYNNTGITIRHLLAHQSGIGHYDNCPDGYDGPFIGPLSQGVVQGCFRCMVPPGSGTIYTSFGSTLLGAIIELVGSQNYRKGYIQLYNEWIKDAVGLPNLTPEYTTNIAGLALGHSSNGSPLFGTWNDLGWKLPAGGFVSNAHDLAKYGAGVMNHSFINTASSFTMWQTQSTSGTPVNLCADGLTGNYGLAFRIGSSGDDLRIAHAGSNDHGYTSLLYLYPNRNAGIVLLTNQYDEDDALSSLRLAIEAKLLCPTNREFTSTINWDGDWVYETQNTIEANNIITAQAGSIVYDAAGSVVLKPGFHAQGGVTFRAVIDGCLGIIRP